ncbi:hypothetical protein VTH82DRAFT_5898 [Thermothelomyces myriococcoides]
MSIRIILDNPPEFYTNLDFIKGTVLLNLSRDEHIGAIIVKLEGESRTALGVPTEHPGIGIGGRERHPNRGDTLHENHKILYKVGQVFPDENTKPAASPYVLSPGQHRFPFQFKFPFNNACGNTEAMARIGGVVSTGGPFGIRVMDGTRQLMYRHVTKTLPPSFTGFPGEAEIRYYLKVTVQRPGFFKENWRYHIGLKFLPIEPPRPAPTNQEAYARRPFTFYPRTPPDPGTYQRKRSSIFAWPASPSTPTSSSSNSQSPASGQSGGSPSPTGPPPSIEMSARLPHPAILTCNKPVPLRLIAKKLVPAHAEVYLVALQIDLIGTTTVRCQNLINREVTRWVIMGRHGLSILLSKPEDPVGTEFIVPNNLWSGTPLPNTVVPSFVTCNLRHDYQLELKLGLAWGKPALPPRPQSSTLFGRPKYKAASEIPQELHLPLHFSTIEVYSGLEPSPQLVEAIRQGRGRTSRPTPGKTTTTTTSSSSSAAAATATTTEPRPTQQQPPQLPPRPAQQQQPQQQPADALYPPQLGPDQVEPPYDDAPPTYEEAMAEMMTGPMFPPGAARPAYSGVTDENGPSSLDGAAGGGGGGRSGGGEGVKQARKQAGPSSA